MGLDTNVCFQDSSICVWTKPFEQKKVYKVSLFISSREMATCNIGIWSPKNMSALRRQAGQYRICFMQPAACLYPDRIKENNPNFTCVFLFLFQGEKSRKLHITLFKWTGQYLWTSKPSLFYVRCFTSFSWTSLVGRKDSITIGD